MWTITRVKEGGICDSSAVAAFNYCYYRRFLLCFTDDSTLFLQLSQLETCHDTNNIWLRPPMRKYGVSVGFGRVLFVIIKVLLRIDGFFLLYFLSEIMRVVTGPTNYFQLTDFWAIVLDHQFIASNTMEPVNRDLRPPSCAVHHQPLLT